MIKFKKSISVLLMVCMIMTMTMPAVSEKTYANSVKLSANSVTLVKGDTKLIRLIGTSGKVTWSTSNKNVATIGDSPSGFYKEIKAKKKGTATIYAKVNGKKYSCKVTVTNGYVLSQKKLCMTKGTNSLLKVASTEKKTVKWSSKDSSIASVNGYGIVVAKKAGDTTIYAKVDNQTLECKVYVSDTFVKVYHRENVNYNGKKYRLTVYVQYKNKPAPSKGNYIHKMKLVASEGNKKETYVITASKKYDDITKFLKKESPNLSDCYSTYFKDLSKINMYKAYYKKNNKDVSLTYEDYTNEKNKKLIKEAIAIIVGPFTGDSMKDNALTMLIKEPHMAIIAEAVLAYEEIHAMGKSMMNMVDHWGAMPGLYEYLSFLEGESDSADVDYTNKQYLANLCKKVIQLGK